MTNEDFPRILGDYDRRVFERMMNLPAWRPWVEEDKRALVAETKASLGIRDEWIPAIEAKTERVLKGDGFVMDCLSARSWEGVTATADLYVPEKPASDPMPFLVLCCGHGGGCKRSPGYQLMARQLCRQGAVVLVPDNIGQGERETMGHRRCPAVFACGTSVQALIVMETIGWIRWAIADDRFDVGKIGALGNSGGGTLSLFLAALAPEVKAAAPSGYPSSFEFVARKEKRHCHCNVLPGLLGKVEMWQLLGCFAPKPLRIFQGNNDNLFPQDVFWATAERVKRVYRMMDAEDQFHAETLEGGHSWTERSRKFDGDFFAETFGLDEPDVRMGEDVLDTRSKTLDPWPENALTADEIARKLTGVDANGIANLADVFPPRTGGVDVSGESFYRGDAAEIFAQLEAWVKETENE